MHWSTIVIPALIAVALAGYLAREAIAEGGDWRDASGMGVLVAIGLGIVFAITGLEEAYLPQLPWKLGDWQGTITIIVAMLVAWMVCSFLLLTWRNFTGAPDPADLVEMDKE